MMNADRHNIGNVEKFVSNLTRKKTKVSSSKIFSDYWSHCNFYACAEETQCMYIQESFIAPVTRGICLQSYTKKQKFPLASLLWLPTTCKPTPPSRRTLFFFTFYLFHIFKNEWYFLYNKNIILFQCKTSVPFSFGWSQTDCKHWNRIKDNSVK